MWPNSQKTADLVTNLLKKFLMENFIICAVEAFLQPHPSLLTTKPKHKNLRFSLYLQSEPTQHLLVQSWPWQHQKNVWNLFKVNNKDTRTTLLMRFWFFLLLTLNKFHTTFWCQNWSQMFTLNSKLW